MAEDAGTAGENERGRRRGVSRRAILKGSTIAGVAGANAGLLADLVGAVQSPVSVENEQTGAEPSEWGSEYDPSIVGYTPDLSVLPGQSVRFKVKTTSTNWRIRIYRLGYYNERGARHMIDLTPTLRNQPEPQVQASTRLVDCGNWQVNATWTVPTNAVSGVYYALFERRDGGGSNHTLFVVRSNNPADVLVQTSDATWHAYNMYGGASLYFGIGDAPFNSQRATKVSYNRPLADITEKESEFFGTEYALVRWLERNGYHVNYCTQLDTHNDAAMLLRHKVFISSGHDEYWTGAQRANVTAARDAKVNLIFFSGNEVFWRTRMEPSIDGSNTPNRTLVCYKETLSDAKVDPSSEWTGTWRDPRFTPPAVGGGQPENSLTGQLFRAINPVNAPDFEIEVPHDYAPLRFWRNTDVAQLDANEKVVLTESTLGYEWDEIVDNGYQPAGTVKLSRTTATANEVLIDNGSTYVRSAMTHHMSLYRAPSGALVFGAGTVQWAYGLDENHRSDPGTATDRNIQQATVNLLADMGVQPSTLQDDLVPATQSADTLPPTSQITGPAAGTALTVGVPVALTGTATDFGGGVVGAVEVSTDAGQTWHPADGTSSWNYIFVPTTVGPIEVRVRATDDSCNIQTVLTTRSYTVGQRSLPAPLFHAGMLPAAAAVTDGDAVEVGLRIQPLEDGYLTAVRFYKGEGNTGTHRANVWSATGQQLRTAVFSNETAAGWQSVPITPLEVTAGSTYVVSVHMPNGHYAATDRFFEQPFELWPLRAPANGEGGSNGLFEYGASSTFPTQSWGATNYWVDAVLSGTVAVTPEVVSVVPAADLASVSTATTVSATFNRSMNASTIVFELVGGDNEPVAGSGVYSSQQRAYTFTPTEPLDPSTVYTATVVSASDSSGGAMLAPHTWSFTTAAAAAEGTVSLWDSSATPAAFSNEPDALELGTRFTSSVGGTVTALQFYKAPGSPGPHVGHLWKADGTLLATAVYNAETASGWQQVDLPTPVSIVAGQQYIVSYFSPAGVYPITPNYFGDAATVSGVLTAPRSTGNTGSTGNGLFRYGPSAVPNGSWNASNYWADVLFVPTPVGNVPAPVVSDHSPSRDLAGVARSSAVSVTFAAAIDPATLELVLRAPGGAVVPSAVVLTPNALTATLTPNSQLAAATTYQVSVTAKSPGGAAMSSPLQWSFTTTATADGTPATLWPSDVTPAVPAAEDNDAVELGTRFTVERDGVITAVRFYKGPGNDGPHVGHLWTAGGSLLGTAQFADETASGWQQAALDVPAEVTAGSTYVVSYHAPKGRYAVASGYFAGSARNVPPLVAPASTGGAGNGLFVYGGGGFPTGTWGAASYFVDVVFQEAAAPKVIATTPAAGAVDVPASSTVSAVFNKAVSAPTVVIEVRDGGGALVGGSVAYDTATRTATFTPAASLLAGATYTVAVAASEPGGAAMTAPHLWAFTVAAPVVQPVLLSLWDDTTVPAVANSGELDSVELGVRFSTDVGGLVRGLRFYKGPGNVGTHVGTLWTDTGQLLKQATFVNETASGWQTLLFDQPVEVLPGRSYVASYHLPNGNYPYDAGYFVNREVVNGPLRAPADGVQGGNGLFVYGSGGFPNQTWGGTNYWIDVIFSPA
jgi:hypothetical protein